MPIISSLTLTNQNPVITYTASVVTSGSIIADGLGNQITYLQLNCASSSFASQSLSASYFYPSKGAVTDAGSLTGSVSASGYGFSSPTEFNNFITSVSSSLQQFNTLLSYLRSSGIIS